MKFRKKPVEVEARLLTLETSEEIKKWCGGKSWSRPPTRAVTGIVIPTLEGNMTAPFGDWIIQGVNNEFYPCKPDIFAKTYEKVEE